MSDGYILLGYARFNAANLNNYQIVDQAKKVGAAIVMVSSKYTGTNIGSIPITTYNPGQTSTSIITGDVNGTVTTTSSGTSQTQYVPYSVNRYDYLVTFWAKTKPPAMGIFFDDLPLSIRQELERNKGLLITTVVKDSPAYNANVIPGDVAIEMNGIELTSKQQFLSLIMQNTGQKVVLKIIRKGQVKEIELQLND